VHGDRGVPPPARDGGRVGHRAPRPDRYRRAVLDQEAATPDPRVLRLLLAVYAEVAALRDQLLAATAPGFDPPTPRSTSAWCASPPADCGS